MPDESYFPPRLSGFFILLLSFVILLSSIVLVFFKPINFQKTYGPWSEFSTEDFSFQYPNGWIVGEKIINGCSNTQTFTIPQNSSGITITNRCNYNPETGKPFSSLEQFLGKEYTFYHYTKVDGIEIGTRYPVNNPGLYSPETIAFLSPHNSSFFIIEFSPAHIKNPAFDHILTSLHFRNIPSPSPAPGIDPSTGLRNLELNHLSFSLQPEWWYKSGVDYYQLNPTTWPGKDNVLPALGIVMETKNNANLNTEKQYLIDTYKLRQVTTTPITISKTPGLIISGTVIAPTGVNCPSCWTSPFSPDEKTKMAVIIYNNEVYRFMGNTGKYGPEFDRLLTTFRLPADSVSPIPTVRPASLRVSDWLTYRNPKLGFEIKYPQNYYLKTEGTDQTPWISISNHALFDKEEWALVIGIGKLTNYNFKPSSDPSILKILDRVGYSLLKSKATFEVGGDFSGNPPWGFYNFGFIPKYLNETSIYVSVRIVGSDEWSTAEGGTNGQLAAIAASILSTFNFTNSDTAGCKVGGCSSELCLEAGSPDVASICIYRADYACYKYSVCEKQSTGKCGWTKTPEFTSCLNSLPNP